MMRKILAGMALAACSLAFSGAVMALGGDRQVTVYYDNIRVVVDGSLLQTQEEPFTLNGRTYVPLRAVGEALGKKISWDDQNKVVIIGDRENLGLYLQDLNGIITKNTSVKVNEKFSMGGAQYAKGVVFSTTRPWRENPDNASQVSFYIPHKFSKITGLAGLADSNKKFSDPVTFRVIADKKVILEKEIKYGDGPVSLDINCEDVSNLAFFVGGPEGIDFCLADMQVQFQ